MIDQDYQVVTPAFGQDFKTAKEAKEKFLAGTDFQLHSVVFGFNYCSIRDFKPGVTVSIRYKQRTMVTHVVVPTPKQ